MSYPAPEVPWDAEQLAFPSLEIFPHTVHSFEEKVGLFDELSEKKKKIDAAFEKSKLALEQNNNMAQKEKLEQLTKIQVKYRKDLNKEAAVLFSSIVHECPVKFAHRFPEESMFAALWL